MVGEQRDNPKSLKLGGGQNKIVLWKVGSLALKYGVIYQIGGWGQIYFFCPNVILKSLLYCIF